MLTLRSPRKRLRNQKGLIKRTDPLGALITRDGTTLKIKRSAEGS